MSTDRQPPDGLEALHRSDACTLANAIESFVRPRNEGFMSDAAPCRFPHRTPIAGHAVTGRIRTYMPPITVKCYTDHIEWWRYVKTVPAPRVAVLEDSDGHPGFGALFGEVRARICLAPGCVTYITNRAVRDVQAMEPLEHQLFVEHISVSHSYAHIVDFGEPIDIGGLKIKPGDIRQGDRYGILSLPAPWPRTCRRRRNREPGMSVERLGKRLQRHSEKQRCR
jgi:4-hydroxy-4-methyl-2-oxoglutarate aldolase